MSSANERVAAIIERVQGPRVLHVGCIGGRFPRTDAERAHWMHGALEDAGHSVIGGDINRDELALMEQAGHEVCYLDAEHIAPDGERFDTIVAGELIEHLANPGLFVAGCVPRLKPGGRLVLTTPNAFGALYQLQYLNSGTFNPEHACWFDQQTLSELVRRNGFAVQELTFVDDLRPEVANHLGYSIFATTWRTVRRVAPLRYRANLLLVATPA